MSLLPFLGHEVHEDALRRKLWRAVSAALAPREGKEEAEEQQPQPAPSRDPGPSVRPSVRLSFTSQNSHDHMLTSSILGPQEKEKEVPLHGL